MERIEGSDDFFIRDLGENRMNIERLRVNKHYPQFQFFNNSNQKERRVLGRLRTDQGNVHLVEIVWSDKYPFEMPDTRLPELRIDLHCQYQYSIHHPCTVHREDWEPTFSILYMIYRTEIWLNKYELWLTDKKSGWPGKGQHK